MNEHDQIIVNTRDLDALKEHVRESRAADQKALDVAVSAMDKRLDGMNEFRDTLRDQSTRFVTREEMASQLATLISDRKTIIEGVDGKVERNTATIDRHEITLAALAAGSSGKSEATDREHQRIQQNRSDIRSAIALVLTLVTICVALFLGLRNSKSVTTELPSCKEVGAGVTCVTAK